MCMLMDLEIKSIYIILIRDTILTIFKTQKSVLKSLAPIIVRYELWYVFHVFILNYSQYEGIEVVYRCHYYA